MSTDLKGIYKLQHNRYDYKPNSITYGHRLKNTRHPVRSAIDKLQIG